MANNLRRIFMGEPKPKEFTNNPKLLKAIKKQKTKNRNLSSAQHDARNTARGGESERNTGFSAGSYSDFTGSTNWG